MNQAIGRVIRHVQDFGNIVLLDARFAGDVQRRQISKWLRDRVQIFEDAGEAVQHYK